MRRAALSGLVVVSGVAVVAALAFAGSLNPPPGPVQPTQLGLAQASPNPANIRSFHHTVTGVGPVVLTDHAASPGHNGFIITDIAYTPSVSWELAQDKDVKHRVVITGNQIPPMLHTTFRSGLAFNADDPIMLNILVGIVGEVTVTGYYY